jgi:hypothetical protein
MGTEGVGAPVDEASLVRHKHIILNGNKFFTGR